MSSFGISLGFGFLISSFLLWRRAREAALNEEKIIDAMIMAVFFGALLGRAGYIISNFGGFGFDFGRWLLFIKYPGFALPGTIMGVVLLLAVNARIAKKDFWELADLFVQPVVVLAIFGYLGQNKYQLAGMYFLLLLVILFLNRKIRNFPEWRKLFEKSGLPALLFLTFTFAINLPVVAVGGVFLFLIRYNKFTR
ncbi:MAG: prolipoprotein diacylglyceryl transferase family protein, partial [Patescibacteria group bacterium]